MEKKNCGTIPKTWNKGCFFHKTIKLYHDNRTYLNNYDYRTKIFYEKRMVLWEKLLYSFKTYCIILSYGLK